MSKRIVVALMLALALTASCKPSPTPLPTSTAVSIASTPTVASLTLPTAGPQPTSTPTELPTATTIPPDVIAVVNGVPILRAKVDAQVAQAQAYFQQQGLDPTSEEGEAIVLQLRFQILDWMIDQELIAQAARREGITITDEEVDAEINKIISSSSAGDEAKFDAWLAENGLTRDSFREQLRSELLSAALQTKVVASLPTTAEQVHARHILVNSEEQAMEVLQRLLSGESFTSLAAQYSQDRSTREDGGDLGFFPRGVMEPNFEAVAFTLQPGQISGIVQTPFGYHIIEVLERDPDRPIPEEMLITMQQTAFVHWLESERSKADIWKAPIE